MQHVDEGILHAYLDGALDALAAEGALPSGMTRSGIEAHLRACPDCAALLERERRSRDAARHVLLDASVTVDAPPFELVARRGAATEPAPVPTAGPARRTLPLAWAASVVIAVGAGWWGSEVLRQPAADATTPATRAASEPAVPESASPTRQAVSSPAAGDLVDAAEAVTPGPAVAAGAAAGPRLAETGRTGPTAAVADPTSAVAGPTSAVVAGPDRVRSGRLEVVTLSSARLADPVTDRVKPVSGAAGVTRTAAREDAAGTTTADRTVVAIEPLDIQSDVLAAPPPAPPAPQPSIMAAASSAASPAAAQGTRFSMDARTRSFTAPPVRQSRESVSPLQTFRAAVAQARSGRLEWRSWSRESTLRAGLPLVRVANGGEPVIEVAGLAGDQPMVRVRQRAGDVMVELLIWQEPGARVLGTGGSLATVVMSSGVLGNGDAELLLRLPALESFVVLSGALDARSLLQLADGLVLDR